MTRKTAAVPFLSAVATSSRAGAIERLIDLLPFCQPEESERCIYTVVAVWAITHGTCVAILLLDHKTDSSNKFFSFCVHRFTRRRLVKGHRAGLLVIKRGMTIFVIRCSWYMTAAWLPSDVCCVAAGRWMSSLARQQRLINCFRGCSLPVLNSVTTVLAKRYFHHRFNFDINVLRR